MLREGTTAKDLGATIKGVGNRDSRNIVLVTDDCDAKTLTHVGHMNHVIDRAIEEGIDPIVAIQMATINTAEHFGLANTLGSIAPNRLADMLILNSIDKIQVETTIIDGKPVAHQGKLLIDIANLKYPTFAKQTIHLKRPIQATDLRINAPSLDQHAKVNVIGVTPGTVVTRHLTETMQVQNGTIKSDAKLDVAKVAVIERHRQTGNIGLGFAKGFRLREGAIATTVSHDCHNIIAVGVNDDLIVKAVNKLVEVDGGYVAVNNQNELAILPLPIAGLMSTKKIETISRERVRMERFIASLGCTDPATLMTLSFIALPVIPELKITDRGLVDVTRFCFIPLVNK